MRAQDSGSGDRFKFKFKFKFKEERDEISTAYVVARASRVAIG